MAEDKLIKSGQITLPRILFLGMVGGIIVATVALGGVWLTVGYWLLTLGISGLLLLIAIDYGVHMEKVDPQAPLGQEVASSESGSETDAQAASRESRPRRRASRATKRRR
ncbi:MAG: hypothetical protein L0229_18370 [Blastocatellia bacterium]|nr:hypothetical protein [Blastocatellia bacterium]